MKPLKRDCLDDGYKCMAAKLEILKASDQGSEVLVTLQEGKFHQVRECSKLLTKRLSI